LILIVGLEMDEKGDIVSVIYHEPESTDASKGAFRKCDVITFMKYWRCKIIFGSRIQ
jgi:hypothetical protein